MSRFAILSKGEASKILGTIAVSKGFHFYLDYHEPTWVVAASLEDFTAKLGKIDLRSVEFHFCHQDFQNWVENVFGDFILVRGINSIDKKAHGEDLRVQLIKIFSDRIKELKEIAANNPD